MGKKTIISTNTCNLTHRFARMLEGTLETAVAAGKINSHYERELNASKKNQKRTSMELKRERSSTHSKRRDAKKKGTRSTA